MLAFLAEFFPESGSDVRRTLDRAKDVVNKFAIDLRDAQISVADFELMKEHRDCFLRLCRLLDEERSADNRMANTVAMALTKRDEELQHFRKEKNLVLSFVNVCQSLGKGESDNILFVLSPNFTFRLVALDDLQNQSSRDVSDVFISALVKRTDDDSIAVVHFALPREIGQYMEPLNRLQSSLVFKQLWRDRGSLVSEERRNDDDVAALAMTLGDLVQQVIEPVFVLWERISERVKKGVISLNEVKDYFKRFGDREKLKAELQLMERSDQARDAKWVKQRVDQICLYNTLSKAVNAARAMIRVCDQLNVSNPFPAVVEIARQVEADSFLARMRINYFCRTLMRSFIGGLCHL